MPAFPWKVELPDAARLGTAAAQTRMANVQAQAGQLGIEAKKQEMAMVPRRAEAVRLYRQGNKGPLAQLDPALFERFEKMGLEQAKFVGEESRAQADAAIKRKTGQIDLLANIAPQIADNPEAARLAFGQLSGHPMFRGEDLTWMQDPAQVQRMAQVLPQMSSKFKEPEFQSLFQEIANKHGYGPRGKKGDYFAALNDKVVTDDLGRYLEAKRTGAAKGTGAQVLIGPNGQMIDPLRPGPHAEAQKQLMSGGEIMVSLNTIKSLAKPEYFTLMGRGRKLKSKYMAHVHPDLVSKKDISYLKNNTKLWNEVKQTFNVYRRLITGAAASVQELEALKASMFNESLSWPEFQAGLEQFAQRTSRAMRLYRKILRQKGVDISPDQARAELNRRMAIIGLDARSSEDMKLRNQDLIEAGVTGAADRLGILAAEGYMDENQLNVGLMKLEGLGG